jgi:hypothetical protein
MATVLVVKGGAALAACGGDLVLVVRYFFSRGSANRCQFFCWLGDEFIFPVGASIFVGILVGIFSLC